MCVRRWETSLKVGFFGQTWQLSGMDSGAGTADMAAARNKRGAEAMGTTGRNLGWSLVTEATGKAIDRGTHGYSRPRRPV
jgi:hypothetical protein